MENLMQGPPAAAGVIDLEHLIHLSHPSMIAQSIPLFDPSSVKQRLASDDEDEQPEPNYGKKGGCSSSPWQRMKWTDDMVRLLIGVIACVGDDGPFDHPDTLAGSKRKPGACALQKKGKWKAVSKLMLEKGCYVSPQQCEDKFNDLNKRYKKLNDILGRGTTCDVVENPALLDSMPHVPPKEKDDVLKILASKHLFYREMCAYHNGHRLPNSHDGESRGCGAALPGMPALKERSRAEVEVAEEKHDDDGEEEDVENVNGYGRNSRKVDSGRSSYSNLQMEMDVILQDGTMSVAEIQDWFRKRTVQLEEERVEIETEAFELEKRRFKWQRFCSKKDRELERTRLENERLGLENQRMSLELKHKEMALEVSRRMELGQLGGFQDGC